MLRTTTLIKCTGGFKKKTIEGKEDTKGQHEKYDQRVCVSACVHVYTISIHTHIFEIV